MTKNTLKWITCNGIKPDLPKGTKVRQIYMINTDEVGITAAYPDYSSRSWENVICYAIEPVDPVKDLVAAARFLSSRVAFGEGCRRLDEAIKAVEEMNDE